MAFEDCVNRIARSGRITAAEARQLFDELHNMAEEKKATGESDPAFRAAMDLANKYKTAAQNARLDTLRNAAKAAVNQSVIDTQGGIKKAFKTIKAMLHYMPGAKHQDSVEGLWHSLAGEWQAAAANKIKQAGNEVLAIKGLEDHGTAEALWRSNGGTPDLNVKISKQAQQIADSLHPVSDLAKERLNAEGAHIGTAIDYVTHTRWNPAQMRSAAGPAGFLKRKLGQAPTADDAFNVWWAKDGPRMADKTFENLVPKEGETVEQAKLRFARSVFDATISGKHMTGPPGSAFGADADGFIPPMYEGTYNIARRVSQQRVIYWKSSGDWLAHMREFGGGDSIYVQMMGSFAAAARSLALMKRFGSNPAAGLERLMDGTIKKYRGDVDGVKEFQGGFNNLRNVMGRLDGSLNVPVHEFTTNLVNAIGSEEAMAHLGGVGLTHAVAIPMTGSTALSFHGINHFEALGAITRGIVEGRGGPERQDALASMGAFAHGYNIEIQRHGMNNSGILGMITKLMANFMKFTPLPFILDRFQAGGLKAIVAERLARFRDQAFKDLDPHLSDLMSRYGINEEEWDLLRKVDPTMADGRAYMTPDMALKTDAYKIEGILRKQGAQWPGRDLFQETGYPPEFENLIAREVKKYQWDLGDKYGTFLNDTARQGVVTPGVRERAFLYQNAQPGSLGWIAARFFGQFKMWPMAAMTQIIGKTIAQSLSKTETASRIGWIIGLSALGGGIRMAVNDLAAGRPQRSFDPLTSQGRAGLLAAFSQGGGWGIYGDFLFGQVSRNDAGIMSTMGGPVVADLEALTKMYNTWRLDVADGKEKAMTHLWPELARFGINHVPFANLIYLKGALDYMLFYHILETASPGWWERTNRRMEREQGRAMYGYTPGGSVPYGVPGIYMQQGNRSTGIFGQGANR